MSIAELKELIQHLPDDMPVVIPHGGETYITACFEQSEIVSFPIEDETMEDGFYYMDTFVIRPCTCEVENAPVVPQEQILN